MEAELEALQALAIDARLRECHRILEDQLQLAMTDASPNSLDKIAAAILEAGAVSLYQDQVIAIGELVIYHLRSNGARPSTRVLYAFTQAHSEPAAAVATVDEIIAKDIHDAPNGDVDPLPEDMLTAYESLLADPSADLTAPAPAWETPDAVTPAMRLRARLLTMKAWLQRTVPPPTDAPATHVRDTALATLLEAQRLDPLFAPARYLRSHTASDASMPRSRRGAARGGFRGVARAAGVSVLAIAALFQLAQTVFIAGPAAQQGRGLQGLVETMDLCLAEADARLHRFREQYGPSTHQAITPPSATPQIEARAEPANEENPESEAGPQPFVSQPSAHADAARTEAAGVPGEKDLDVAPRTYAVLMAERQTALAMRRKAQSLLPSHAVDR
ncbi:hypothetical protein CXG81DRAFT_17592 [Caulochytrium protostelioides]|uniref:Uncharacterized protein n=1 Tax=Caulochytrium protostelioides TaxID=1555241 RepID=A0A4P9XBM5_9FUNG|nr:hypothetical protein CAUPRSCDRAFT_10727 [Caulochytrium protostelioides]RKP02796.1 hypothetical protein CXG81DRAFT_17592 [Caulochytrium protostelioides]|eukprot:RKP02796.1 hypothetical protein CXG81DRAFT_17592 [Caulochytrium protostelioides]